MRSAKWLSVVFLALSLGCGGGGKKSSSAPSAGPENADGASWEGSRDESGLPAWVNRGSAAVTKDGRRVFYGVGLASGIKNPALLRSTADNRARAELAKMFEVFSASLMKDYMNSAGDQNVEQAIKSFSSMSLEGTEVVDRYIAGDGTMYALAALDLKKVVEGVRQAKKLGAVKSHVEKVDVDDIFDQHSKKPEQPKPIIAEGTGGGGAGAPPSKGGEPRRAGEKPPWVTGPDANYPASEYLCAVGFGAKRDIAENGAYAAISKIFSANVESVSKDFMGAYSQTGAQPVEVQSSEQLTKVSTQKVLSGILLPEMWEDGAAKVLYVLACINRPRASQSLREEIAQLDQDAGNHLERASKLDKAGRISALSKALNAIVHREVLNGELRIVDADGVGESGPYSHADVAAAFDAAVEALKVGVKVDGPHDDDFRGALIDGLTQRGYQVTELDGEGEEGLDVLVYANTRVDDAGEGSGSMKGKYFAVGVIQVEVKNTSTNKIFASFSESRKEGSRSPDEAERLAIRKLSAKVTNQIGAKIDAKMRGE